jgi:hypothetical protein
MKLKNLHEQNELCENLMKIRTRTHFVINIGHVEIIRTNENDFRAQMKNKRCRSEPEKT